MWLPPNLPIVGHGPLNLGPLRLFTRRGLDAYTLEKQKEAAMKTRQFTHGQMSKIVQQNFEMSQELQGRKTIKRRTSGKRLQRRLRRKK